LENQRRQIFKHGPGPAKQHPTPDRSRRRVDHGEPVGSNGTSPEQWRRNSQARPHLPRDRSRRRPDGLRDVYPIENSRRSASYRKRMLTDSDSSRPPSMSRLPQPAFHQPAISTSPEGLHKGSSIRRGGLRLREPPHGSIGGSEYNDVPVGEIEKRRRVMQSWRMASRASRPTERPPFRFFSEDFDPSEIAVVIPSQADTCPCTARPNRPHPLQPSADSRASSARALTPTLHPPQ